MSEIIRTPKAIKGGITPAEKEKMAELVKYWTAVAFRTAPIEPDKITPAIESLYAAAGLAKPIVVIVPSPRVMALAGGFAAAIWYSRSNPHWAQTLQATDLATNLATRQATLQATFQATEQATDQEMYRATDLVTRQATDQATRQATDQATLLATDQATKQATYLATLLATRQETYLAMDQKTDLATRQATKQATDLVTNLAMARATFLATDQATLLATDQEMRRATDLVTRQATLLATRHATNQATDLATFLETDQATLLAMDQKTDLATRQATLQATDLATNLAMARATDQATNQNDPLVALMLSCAANWWRMYQGGNMWASWPCYLAAFRDVLGLRLEGHAKYKTWEDCAIHGGFRIMHEKFCMVSDFPEVLKVDDENRPHCEDGPSHRWRDGWELYYWHGVQVTEQIIKAPHTLTVEDVRREENVEVRRVMVERMGWDRFVAESDMRVIHADTLRSRFPRLAPSAMVDNANPESFEYVEGEEQGELLESGFLRDFENRPLKFVRLTCPSTNRRFVMRTHHDATRVYAAVARQFRMTEKEYKTGKYIRQGDVLVYWIDQSDSRLSQAHS